MDEYFHDAIEMIKAQASVTHMTEEDIINIRKF